MNYWLFILPLSSALIGWLAIRVLVHFVFRRVIPGKFNYLSKKIAALAASQVNLDSLEKKISSPDSLQKITPMIEVHVDEFLRVRLKQEMPMISMFVGDKTIDKMKSALMREIENLFPQIMQKFTGNLKEDINVEKIILEKFSALNPATIEKGFYQYAGKELRQAYFLGAVVGFIIGVLQMLALWFLT